LRYRDPVDGYGGGASYLRQPNRRAAVENEIMRLPAVGEVDPFRRLKTAIARLSTVTSGGGLLEEFLEGSIDLLRADMGNIQLLHHKRGVLRIAAQRGFDRHFLAHFESVRADSGGSCGAVLARRKAVVVEDVMADRLFESCREVAVDSGYLSVQSTPIIVADHLIGVVSTHFRGTHAPTEDEMAALELYASLAGRLISPPLERSAPFRELVMRGFPNAAELLPAG
jgi:GAF domain-containing protein